MPDYERERGELLAVLQGLFGWAALASCLPGMRKSFEDDPAWVTARVVLKRIEENAE